MIEVIGLDADDTLWHNESLYADIQAKFRALLAPYLPADAVDQALLSTEMRNLPYYGYGIKAFTLSMIEAAIAISDARIPASDLREILAFAKEMLATPVRLLEGVETTLATLARSYTLMLVTKGDLLDQEIKIERSGLGPFFEHVEIVRDKTPEIYRSLLEKHQILPQSFLMVGNSLRSDVLPLVGLGAHAVHIPYHITWAHEATDVAPEQVGGYGELERIAMLPGYIRWLDSERER